MRAPKESVLHGVASMAMIAASIYLLVATYQVRTRQSAVRVLTPYKVGDTLAEVEPLRSLASERLLLMWIQSTCRYCTQSMTFYRRLADDSGRRVRLLAMGPEPEDVLRSYLKKHGVELHDVMTGPRGTRLYSTPTLLVLEPGLKVSSVWTGVLDREEEERLVAAIHGLDSPLK